MKNAEIAITETRIRAPLYTLLSAFEINFYDWAVWQAQQRDNAIPSFSRICIKFNCRTNFLSVKLKRNAHKEHHFNLEFHKTRRASDFSFVDSLSYFRVPRAGHRFSERLTFYRFCTDVWRSYDYLFIFFIRSLLQCLFSRDWNSTLFFSSRVAYRFAEIGWAIRMFRTTLRWITCRWYYTFFNWKFQWRVRMFYLS